MYTTDEVFVKKGDTKIMKNDSSISFKTKSKIVKNDHITPVYLCNMFASNVILLVW